MLGSRSILAPNRPSSSADILGQPPGECVCTPRAWWWWLKDRWLATITLAGVLPHEGMLPVGFLSFGVHPGVLGWSEIPYLGSPPQGPPEALGWDHVLMVQPHFGCSVVQCPGSAVGADAFRADRFIRLPESRLARSDGPEPFPSLVLRAMP